VHLAPVHLVLDAVVREERLAVEVRQIVVTRPIPDLTLAAVRAAVAVGVTAVVVTSSPM
jgi:hypothetical protein